MGGFSREPRHDDVGSAVFNLLLDTVLHLLKHHKEEALKMVMRRFFALAHSHGCKEE